MTSREVPTPANNLEHADDFQAAIDLVVCCTAHAHRTCLVGSPSVFPKALTQLGKPGEKGSGGGAIQ
jgi:hypothetical protein